jgi:hypothetical protein
MSSSPNETKSGTSMLTDKAATPLGRGSPTVDAPSPTDSLGASPRHTGLASANPQRNPTASILSAVCSVRLYCAMFSDLAMMPVIESTRLRSSSPSVAQNAPFGHHDQHHAATWSDGLTSRRSVATVDQHDAAGSSREDAQTGASMSHQVTARVDDDAPELKVELALNAIGGGRV